MVSIRRNMFMLFVLSPLAFGLVGCNTESVGLAKDWSNPSKCPPNGCAGLAPDKNQLMVKGPESAIVTASAATHPFVEFSGDCYASTYPMNRIEVTVNLENGGQIALTNNDVKPIILPSGSSLKCDQGRYGFVIDGSKMPSAMYDVQVSIVGIDDYGNLHRNSNGGVFNTKVNRF